MCRTIICLAIATAFSIPSVASAAVFTVGIGGTYSTLQAALTDAANTAGDHMIKVREGTFVESIDRQTAMVADRITISGGWKVFFNGRNLSPGATSIIAPTQERAAAFELTGGEIVFDGITFTGGAVVGSEEGGGVYALPYYDASFVMRHCRIVNNEVNSLLPYGGGLYLHASGTSHAEITDCTVSGNSVTSSGSANAAGGAGIYLAAFSQASVEMSWLTVEYNEGWSYSTAVSSGGMFIWADDAATVTLEDSMIANNSINGTGVSDVAGVRIIARVLSQVDVHRVALLDTDNTTSSMPDHLRINAYDSAVVTLTDSVIGPSTCTYKALQVVSEALATVNSSNLTITGCPGYAYRGVAAGPYQSIYNSIIYGNGSDTLVNDGDVATGGNLVATDPLFTAPADRNYQIRTGSLAINAGNNSPPGGLSALDYNHMERVHDGTVDVGAHEWGNLFADDFEIGSANRWD